MMQAIPAPAPAQTAPAPRTAAASSGPGAAEATKSFNDQLSSAGRKLGRRAHGEEASGGQEKQTAAVDARAEKCDRCGQNRAVGTGASARKGLSRQEEARQVADLPKSGDLQGENLEQVLAALTAGQDDALPIEDLLPSGRQPLTSTPDKPFNLLSMQETPPAAIPRQPATSSPKQPVLTEDIEALLARAGAGAADRRTTGSPAAVQAPGQEEVVVEGWQARFSYQNHEMAATSQPQFIEEPAARHGTGGVSLNPQQGQVQDTDARYIHSTLPSLTDTNGQGKEGGDQAGQQNGGPGGQQAGAQAEVLQQPGPTGQDQGPPLVFSVDQENSGALSQQGQTSTTTLTLRLPSGGEVPHSRILDQVVNRFTTGRTLESGSVTLRLQPAELGELHMEIKVEQDNIKAHITTQNPQVQEILDRNLPRLREALAQQGLSLEQMTVSLATDSDANPQTFQEQFSRQQANRNVRSVADSPAFTLDEWEEDEETTTNDEQNLSVMA